MTHYLVTNRQIFKDKKGEFIKSDGGETPSENLRFGTFDSTLYLKTKDSRKSVILFADPNAPDLRDVITDAETQPYTPGIVNEDPKSLQGSQRFFAELYQNMMSVSGDLLFFVHGFHTDLDGALQSICDLEEKYINDKSPIKHIVSFTWPAMNKLLRYRDDAKDAELSGQTLGRCYLMLIDFFRAIFGPNTNQPINAPCNNNIHLLAHSMGNRVVESMMTKLLSERDGHITAIFKEIILAASDVDWQVFEDPHSFNKLTEIGQRATVYYNTKDIALFISETTKNAFNRLGKYGFRDYNKVPAHVYSVDCSRISDESGIENKLIEHWYYKESLRAVNDITQVLKGVRVEDLIGQTRTAIPSIPIQFRLIV